MGVDCSRGKGRRSGRDGEKEMAVVAERDGGRRSGSGGVIKEMIAGDDGSTENGSDNGDGDGEKRDRGKGKFGRRGEDKLG
ncbi:MAG: hypothetical protein B5M54_07465 [Candidatus Aminicenantes bacterium 4484_214]|nr:MAG: hypothetical protein B5M54_07465 [Candidatus Aminicenantes bacterium 4484_214]RLE06651.1 MAG: hypothetical protein DRJ06_07380 [Candidatus Aminicenantes bacterium]